MWHFHGFLGRRKELIYERTAIHNPVSMFIVVLLRS